MGFVTSTQPTLNYFNFFGTDGLGTLIASRWAITAAHTARNIHSLHKVAIAGKHYAIEQAILHPDFQGKTPQDAQNDIALVQLSEPVLDAGLFIAGISSWQDDDEQGQYGLYGVWEYYARVSKYIDWIFEIVNPIY